MHSVENVCWPRLILFTLCSIVIRGPILPGFDRIILVLCYIGYILSPDKVCVSLRIHGRLDLGVW